MAGGAKKPGGRAKGEAERQAGSRDHGQVLQAGACLSGQAGWDARRARPAPLGAWAEAGPGTPARGPGLAWPGEQASRRAGELSQGSSVVAAGQLLVVVVVVVIIIIIITSPPRARHIALFRFSLLPRASPSRSPRPHLLYNIRPRFSSPPPVPSFRLSRPGSVGALVERRRSCHVGPHPSGPRQTPLGTTSPFQIAARSAVGSLSTQRRLASSTSPSRQPSQKLTWDLGLRTAKGFKLIALRPSPAAAPSQQLGVATSRLLAWSRNSPLPRRNTAFSALPTPSGASTLHLDLSLGMQDRS
ncbi:uncharacterized protein PSFLO_05290 [Pseudozyma flocculosa]|uniref:Uncharacterized protein n=1 Tax=Pseudozyma flocculosa TaxID=84751 RepID=A0A5C3F8Y3_9BASI|nr:uncharacterized protein PSFLO_05290 [Pseudozyma flocculosa]